MLRGLAGPVRALGSAFEKFGAAIQADKAYTEILSRHREILAVGGVKGAIDSSCFVAPSASLIGDVSVGPKSSVWYGAILLGDGGKITVGEGSHIKDRAVVSGGCSVGAHVVVGAGAVLGAKVKVGDGANVGGGATVGDGATIAAGAAVAPGSVVEAGASISAGQLYAGSPAKALRALTAEEKDRLLSAAQAVMSLAKVHKAENAKDFVEIEQDKSDLKWGEERSVDYDGSLGLLEKNPRAQVW